MECGFCEKVCPSRELTLTPRQRIAVRKEIVRLENMNHRTAEENVSLQSLRRAMSTLVSRLALLALCVQLSAH